VKLPFVGATASPVRDSSRHHKLFNPGGREYEKEGVRFSSLDVIVPLQLALITSCVPLRLRRFV
jgi:hypothetical protein